MKVRELIEELKKMPQEMDVYMEDAGEPSFGSELTGYMGSADAEVEGVRKHKECVVLHKY